MKSKGKEQTRATRLHFTPKPKGENPGSCVVLAPGTSMCLARDTTRPGLQVYQVLKFIVQGEIKWRSIAIDVRTCWTIKLYVFFHTTGNASLLQNWPWISPDFWAKLTIPLAQEECPCHSMKLSLGCSYSTSNFNPMRIHIPPQYPSIYWKLLLDQRTDWILPYWNHQFNTIFNTV